MEEAPNTDPKDDLLELEFEPNGGCLENPEKESKITRSTSHGKVHQPDWRASSLQKSQLNIASLSGYFKENTKYFSELNLKDVPVQKCENVESIPPYQVVQTVQLASKEILPPIKANFPSLKVCRHTQLSSSLEKIKAKKIKVEQVDPGPRAQIVTNMINLFSKIRPMIQLDAVKDVRRNQHSLKVLRSPKLNQSRLQPILKGPRELQVLPVTELPQSKSRSPEIQKSNKGRLTSDPDPVSEPALPFDKDRFLTLETEKTQQSAREKHEVLQNFYKNCFIKRPKLRHHFPSASLAQQSLPQSILRSESPGGRAATKVNREATEPTKSKSPSPKNRLNFGFYPRAESQSQSMLTLERPLLACESLDIVMTQSAITGGKSDAQKNTAMLPPKQASKLTPQPARRLQRSTHLFVNVPPGRQTLRPLAALLQPSQGTVQLDAA